VTGKAGTGGRGGDASDVRELGALVRARPARAGGTRVLAIDGLSGSGKSTLAAGLAAGLAAPLVSLEDLYGGWDGLEHGIDLLVAEVLEPLAAGKTAHVPSYDWISERWREPVPLPPPELLVVEGVGAGARRAARYESLIVWLAAPLAVRKKKALERDGQSYLPHWDRWASQEEAMLAREQTPERADVVLTGAGVARGNVRP
jgi:uridine kinase